MSTIDRAHIKLINYRLVCTWYLVHGTRYQYPRIIMIILAPHKL